jgi:hypothetical protein
MKKLFLLGLLAVAVGSQAQEKKPSLKDLLYGGKLKKDSTGVIRSTDDLSSKIDTSTKKEAEPEKAKAIAALPDSAKKLNTVIDSAGVVATTEAGPTDATTAGKPNTPVRSNTKIWKEYTDSLVSTLKAEVLSSKQIKKETYYILMDYEIGTDGAVTVTSVSATPANAFLQSQISQLVDSTPLHLAPALDSNGQPRKVKRKQSFTVTKD